MDKYYVGLAVQETFLSVRLCLEHSHIVKYRGKTVKSR